jgi:polyhydroxybutyrate depolymerase
VARSNRNGNATPCRRPQARIAAAVAAGALILGVYGVAGGLASAAASSAPTGCGIRVTASSTITLTPTIAGHRRTVIVHIPQGYAETTKTPLVLNLPGSGETAVQQELLTDMNATADADHFIVAYPQALIPDGTGYDWNIPGVPLIGGKPVPAGAPNDVAFLTDLPGYLEAHYCINPARVYASGISGGGRMASKLACDASTIYAAVAPVAGLRRPTPCSTTRPVPVIAFHGTADPVDPYNGHGQPYWTYSVPQAEAYWASQDGCTTKPTVSHPDPTVTLTTYGDCHAGTIVELYTITGEGHEWPGGPRLPAALTAFLGPQTTAVSANTTMWAFFKTHPLP